MEPLKVEEGGTSERIVFNAISKLSRCLTLGLRKVSREIITHAELAQAKINAVLPKMNMGVEEKSISAHAFKHSLDKNLKISQFFSKIFGDRNKKEFYNHHGTEVEIVVKTRPFIGAKPINALPNNPSSKDSKELQKMLLDLETRDVLYSNLSKDESNIMQSIKESMTPKARAQCLKKLRKKRLLDEERVAELKVLKANLRKKNKYQA